MKKKVLVIVAHPDDETIWMGGLLIQNKNKWNTTIISLCRKDDKDRAPKFKKVCEFYKAKWFISDLEDDKLDELQSSEITQRIKQFADKSYDYIFTHGKNGEYGHIRHKEVHNAVKNMIEANELRAEKIFFFAYTKRGETCHAAHKSDKFIKLKASQLKLKKKIIQEMYGFNKNGFEERCCRDTEAFLIKEVR